MHACLVDGLGPLVVAGEGGAGRGDRALHGQQPVLVSAGGLINFKLVSFFRAKRFSSRFLISSFNLFALKPKEPPFLSDFI
jgi:hypothetical protein